MMEYWPGLQVIFAHSERLLYMPEFAVMVNAQSGALHPHTPPYQQLEPFVSLRGAMTAGASCPRFIALLFVSGHPVLHHPCHYQCACKRMSYDQRTVQPGLRLNPILS